MSHAPSVGGFFALELGTSVGDLPPPDVALLKSGRACLRFVLEDARPSRVIAPFYVCDAALAPARHLGLPIDFYAIDRTLKPLLPSVKAGDLVLVVDYFGLCGEALVEFHRLGAQLIVDQTHALFAEGPANTWRFTSARKWFGVPDGAFLSGPQAVVAPEPTSTSTLPLHLTARRWGDAAQAYAAYREAEDAFDVEISPVSRASVDLLRSVDAGLVRKRRRENFRYLAERLDDYNELDLRMNSQDVPFCYPFLPKLEVSRSELAKAGIFVPRFWEDCLTRSDPRFSWECSLARRLLPLPIDHRYASSDMDRVATKVLEALS